MKTSIKVSGAFVLFAIIVSLSVFETNNTPVAHSATTLEYQQSEITWH